MKILRLEREQGAENRAVIGGLQVFGPNWKQQMVAQAKRPEQVVLAEELADLMTRYGTLQSKTDRLNQLEYMLDRMQNRKPMPAEYQSRLEALRAEMGETAPAQAAPSEERRPERGDRRERPRQEGSERGQSAAPAAQEGKEGKEGSRREGRKDRDRERGKERDKDRGPRQGRGESGGQSRPPRQAQRPPADADADGDDPAEAVGLSDGGGDGGESAYDSYFRPTDGGKLDIEPLPRLARPPRAARGPLDLEAAMAAQRELRQPVSVIKGVGPGIGQTFAEMGIQTVQDLLHYLPRRYDDYTRLRSLRWLKVDEVATVIGTVTYAESRISGGGRRDFFMNVEDGTGRLAVTFFGQHFLARTLRKGAQVVLSGKVSIYRQMFQMSNPEWELLEADHLHTIGIVPVYRMKEGLKPRSFRRTMKRVVDEWSARVPDPLPVAVLDRAELADLSWALRNLHFPEGWDHLEHARRRYVFDQLLALQLAILNNRREWQAVPGQALTVDDGFMDAFMDAVFPFALTSAQQRAIYEIRQDVSKPVPMNRLIQGDVGSGKTAVAMAAMAMALGAGKQAALMAPTSILAEQHYRGISAALERTPGEQRPVVALLTSAVPASEREGIFRGMADGSVDIVIGTHALIQQGVEFHDLALVVIDEQHRFGVEQRAALRGKGTNPHLLVMTATPIPRTLALTLYADLDLSIIDEKPAGRQEIKTYMLAPKERPRALSFIESQLEKGRQAFVVHPLVEASDKLDARSAVEAYDEFQQIFYKHRVCLLHGRMRPAEKDAVMEAFAHHEYDLMVTTTVAEVGVNVPNATVMLIEGANRFGMAQLHQLRGRVGRGEHASTCILIPDAISPEAAARLEEVVATDDGFKLAEADWKQRGAGDLLGTRQSGSHLIEMAEAITPDLVALAQREARSIFADDPELSQPQHGLLRLLVEQQRNQGDGEGDLS